MILRQKSCICIVNHTSSGRNQIPKCPNLGHLGANYHVATHEPQACDQCKNSGGFLKVFDLKCTSVWQIGDFLQHFVALAVQAVKLVMH